jgi:predicted nucleotidyltransferase component of viral defense system
MRRLNPGEQKLLSDIQAEDVALSRLPLGMLEKDVFVTEVTIALSTLSSDSVGVIFCGGTSLSKAHRIVSRMSEDINFKIDVTDKSKAKIIRELCLVISKS